MRGVRRGRPGSGRPLPPRAIRGGAGRPATPSSRRRAPRPARRSAAHPSSAAPCWARQASSRVRSPDGSAAHRWSSAACLLAPRSDRGPAAARPAVRGRRARGPRRRGPRRRPRTSSIRRRRGWRHRRLDGEYGLAGNGATGVAACSGLSPTAPPPWPPTHRASERTSARSPMPQLARLRLVGTCTARPQVRRPSGRWQRPGRDEQRRRRRAVGGVEVGGAPAAGRARARRPHRGRCRPRAGGGRDAPGRRRPPVARSAPPARRAADRPSRRAARHGCRGRRRATAQRCRTSRRRPPRRRPPRGQPSGPLPSRSSTKSDSAPVSTAEQVRL